MICDECGHECEAIEVDNGIGPYEFWGSKGVHTDMQWVSPCCEADVVEGGSKFISKSTHTARKKHGYGIEPGDRYEKTVNFHWRENGPGWYSYSKKKLKV